MARLSLSKPCTERSPCNRPRGGTRNCPVVAPSFGLAALKHDPEKCAAVFGKDHAQTRTWSGMPIQGKIIPHRCAPEPKDLPRPLCVRQLVKRTRDDGWGIAARDALMPNPRSRSCAVT